MDYFVYDNFKVSKVEDVVAMDKKLQIESMHGMTSNEEEKLLSIQICININIENLDKG